MDDPRTGLLFGVYFPYDSVARRYASEPSHVRPDGGGSISYAVRVLDVLETPLSIVSRSSSVLCVDSRGNLHRFDEHALVTYIPEGIDGELPGSSVLSDPMPREKLAARRDRSTKPVYVYAHAPIWGSEIWLFDRRAYVLTEHGTSLGKACRERDQFSPVSVPWALRAIARRGLHAHEGDEQIRGRDPRVHRALVAQRQQASNAQRGL